MSTHCPDLVLGNQKPFSPLKNNPKNKVAKSYKTTFLRDSSDVFDCIFYGAAAKQLKKGTTTQVHFFAARKKCWVFTLLTERSATKSNSDFCKNTRVWVPYALE